ncbi:MAG TPA: GGDEF domain-containing protein [Streptosporangiaceae bacterium]|jgi:diguanylate cyclase (GGDEF)-like protein
MLRRWADRFQVRDWAIWELSPWMRVHVAAVIAAELICIAAAAAQAPLHGSDLRLAAVLMACNLATVELTHRSGEPAGLVKDVHAVWELPLALLLPPLYGLMAPIPRMILTQWRVRSTLLHRRAFTASAVGLAGGAASLAFHAAVHAAGSAGSRQEQLLIWAALVAAAGALKSGINKILVWTAVKGTDPAASARRELFSREPLFNDAAELGCSVMVSQAVTFSPVMALVALPLVALLHRSFRHAQLLADGRYDSKTGLLNAATWQREARLETARAARAGQPLAVAIADIDFFKRVNDEWGHLAGDAVLAAVARAISALLRDEDITGRFGGEEFTVLLPRTSPAEALRIAERLCAKIALIAMPIGVPGGPPLRITISIGLAVLGPGRRDLDDLLAAADHALYEAKEGGRNQVCMRAEPSAGSPSSGFETSK